MGLGLADRLSQPRTGSKKKRSGLKSGHDKPLEPDAPSHEQSRKPSRVDRFMRYASEAQMPIYVLHQTIIVAIGFFVVRWQFIWPAKYLLISLSTLLVKPAIYGVMVGRTRVTRFLFGLKPKKKEQVAVPAPRTSWGIEGKHPWLPGDHRRNLHGLLPSAPKTSRFPL